MGNITAKLVKDLRDKTGAGMMDCKKALNETDGNVDKALEWLRKKGIASAEKKSGRVAVLRRELERLQKYLGGLKGMRRLPDVVVLVDQRRESNAVLEARKLDISLVSMLDTNCDPDLCEVPIPCNDDAVRSVQLILGRLADAINEGRKGSNAERKN